MAGRRSQNSKRKWTDRMNADVLACKIEAIALTKLESPPLDQNGKKKGYIKLMEELWNAKGYGGLGFSRQNLRDQAARLEKQQRITNDNVNQTRESRNEVNSRQFEESEILNLFNSEENYGNSSQETDLHMSSSSQIPVDSTQTESILEDYNSLPGCLPEFNPVAKPNEIFWSFDSDGVPIIIPTSTITSAYNEIVTWKKNAFLVPYGRTGKDFIDELTSRINDWNNGTDLQRVSLKVVFVFLAVAPQDRKQKIIRLSCLNG